VKRVALADAGQVRTRRGLVGQRGEGAPFLRSSLQAPSAAGSTDAARLRAVQLARDALPPELAHLADGPIAEALAEAVVLAQGTLSAATERIYADDWAAFVAWCGECKAPSLPAHPAVVAGYLAHRSRTLGRSGLRLVLAAVAHHHRRTGHLWSSANPTIATVMRGILRRQRTPVRPAAALGTAEVRRLLATCGEDRGDRRSLAGLRDRALLLTAFAGGLRRSELVALDVTDLRFASGGLVLRIQHSKTDQEGQGAELGITPGRQDDTCPVRALQGWLRRADLAQGAVFRGLSAQGTLRGRLTGNGVWKILRRRAALAGLTVPDGERLSPHGFRAGFITEAYLNGALDEQVMAHARQRDINVTRGYRKRAKVVAASPARLLDL
jgi:integrase